jgi:dTDP-glucose 4,6-dehydratase
MPEKFLVLGANSFYGSSFAKLVEERGDEVVLCKHYGSDPACDYVVNFASKSLVEESWKNPLAWVRANVHDFTDLLEATRWLDIKKFVHVSTPEVYGSTPYWYLEDERFDPTTPYAVSRLAGDMMLKAYFKAYGFPMLITRTANIYGPGQQSHRIIPKAIQYKKEGKVLPLHGDGWSQRSFIHIKDACEATYLLCKEGLLGETYHISTKEVHWIRELVTMIGCETKNEEDRLGKDSAYLLNSDKIRRLGWQDKVTLEQGLCELLT